MVIKFSNFQTSFLSVFSVYQWFFYSDIFLYKTVEISLIIFLYFPNFPLIFSMYLHLLTNCSFGTLYLLYCLLFSAQAVRIKTLRRITIATRTASVKTAFENSVQKSSRHTVLYGQSVQKVHHNFVRRRASYKIA